MNLYNDKNETHISYNKMAKKKFMQDPVYTVHLFSIRYFVYSKAKKCTFNNAFVIKYQRTGDENGIT